MQWKRTLCAIAVAYDAEWRMPWHCLLLTSPFNLFTLWGKGVTHYRFALLSKSRFYVKHWINIWSVIVAWLKYERQSTHHLIDNCLLKNRCQGKHSKLSFGNGHNSDKPVDSIESFSWKKGSHFLNPFYRMLFNFCDICYSAIADKEATVLIRLGIK